MLYYQLQWLENAHINNITILTQTNAHKIPSQTNANKIREYITNVYEANPETCIEVTVLEEYSGTCDALRSLKDKIKTDFIVLSCDLIITVPSFPILNFHRINEPACTALFYHPLPTETDTKNSDEGDIVAIHEASSRLLLSTQKCQLSDLNLRVSMLRNFSNIKLSSTLQSAHFYIFKRQVMDLIIAKKEWSSISADLVPTLTKAQFSNTISAKENFHKYGLGSQDTLSCLAYTVNSSDSTTGYIVRANTIPTYLSANRTLIPPSPSTCLIAPSARLSEKCVLRKTVIGSHCVIGKGVKLINSVIMDYAVIEDYVKLDNSVVCTGAQVGEKSGLTGCEVGVFVVISRDTIGKGETYV